MYCVLCICNVIFALCRQKLTAWRSFPTRVHGAGLLAQDLEFLIRGGEISLVGWHNMYSLDNMFTILQTRDTFKKLVYTS